MGSDRRTTPQLLAGVFWVGAHVYVFAPLLELGRFSSLLKVAAIVSSATLFICLLCTLVSNNEEVPHISTYSWRKR